MRSDAVANRQRILDAAMELFIEKGTDADVREICDRAGIGMGTLYRHFPTKDDLVKEVVLDVAHQLQGVMDRFERGENVRPPLVEWLEFHEKYGRVGREVQARFSRPETSDKKFNEQLEPMRGRRFKQWLALAEADGIRGDIPPRFLMEASDGLIATYLDLRDRWDPAQTREWLASLFANGILPRRPKDRGSVEFPKREQESFDK
ncbi:MAG: TetR/AcrR family transcriptional regulator [Dehalococcoidia bacterium]